MLEIVKTKDGSDTIYSTDFDEIYHSRNGAVAESVHVFLENGLHLLISQSLSKIKIFEVGFGTGLNTLLTLRESMVHNQNISYTTIEPLAIPKTIADHLNYSDFFEKGFYDEFFPKLHQCNWNQPVLFTPNFSFQKYGFGLDDYQGMEEEFDLIYFDAFAPDKQPQMWAIEVFEKIYGLLKTGGIFVTYSAKGQLKRDLRALGFTVENPPGPIGKREMTRAFKY